VGILAQITMNRLLKILLTLGAFILGFVFFGVAWTMPLEPYWLNSVFAVLGVGLEIGTIIFVLYKIGKEFNK
jgi:hypothetical protein